MYMNHYGNEVKTLVAIEKRVHVEC